MRAPDGATRSELAKDSSPVGASPSLASRRIRSCLRPGGSVHDPTSLIAKRPGRDADDVHEDIQDLVRALAEPRQPPLWIGRPQLVDVEDPALDELRGLDPDCQLLLDQRGGGCGDL